MDDKTKKFEEIILEINAESGVGCAAFSKKNTKITSRRAIIGIIRRVNSLLFPDFYTLSSDRKRTKCEVLQLVFESMKNEIEKAFLMSKKKPKTDPENLAYEIVGELPKIKRLLLSDANAIYEGDPAAISEDEVILSYPGFWAISIYRLAHEFYIRSIPYIPRVMTEFAHERTGIDIHAGASIGESFCIDHGTGIVIGETTTIGSRVKIYQGVTLGAKSVEAKRDGGEKKKTKRHPDIGDDCIIYANATILGGKTHVGRGSIIGGNVWLTHSVPDSSKIYYTPK